MLPYRYICVGDLTYRWNKISGDYHCRCIGDVGVNYHLGYARSCDDAERYIIDNYDAQRNAVVRLMQIMEAA